MNYKEIFENIVNDDYDIEDLIKLHQYCNDMYYNSENESPLSDSEFDIIDKIYKESVENSSIGSEVRGEKVPLPCIMGSLIQVYENETLKWIEKIIGKMKTLLLQINKMEILVLFVMTNLVIFLFHILEVMA